MDVYVMKIEKDTVVTLSYQVRDIEDQVVDPGEQPLDYLHGGYEAIFPVVEAALSGKVVGDAFEVRVEPEDAFGLYDVSLMKIEPRHLFPEDIQEGMMFEGKPEGGSEDDVIIYRLTDIGEDTVIVDGNHPLAGVPIIFSGEVLAIRAATATEIEHQHVHHGECK